MSEVNPRRIFSAAALIAGVSGIVLLLLWMTSVLPYKPGVLALGAAAALAITAHATLRSFAFTAWVLMCAGTALAHPDSFIQWGDFTLATMIVPLVQIIMFGMGTTLSVGDFTRVAKAPWPVFIGLILQFSIMPAMGFVLALSFGFSGEIAAGIVLIGASAGGVASNLMAYLARGNVALSVTMTCVSTMVAPLMTPMLMQLFAGTFVPIDTFAMMVSILNMIIVPVIAGLIAHQVLYNRQTWAGQGGVLLVITGASALLALGAWRFDASVLGRFEALGQGTMLGAALLSLVAGAKFVMNVMLGHTSAWMDRALPLTSMAGICAIIVIIIAQTHTQLMEVGLWLVLCAVIHNGSGYVFGYWGARGGGWMVGRVGHVVGMFDAPTPRIDEAGCRTVAFEVGMQNGGMATGLAINALQSADAALPPNVFGTWMNISGSLLANWWKARPTLAPADEQPTPSTEPTTDSPAPATHARP